MPRLADYAQHAGERFPTAAPAEVVTSMDSDYPAEAASADVGETDVEQLDLPQVPVGSPLTLTLKLPQVEGVILLKAGPLVIRLDPETWNTVGTSLTLPAFELMRSADAELYLLNQEGQLIASYPLRLVPRES